MRFLKHLLTMTLAASVFAVGGLYADEQDGSRFDEELNERDFDALRDYLKAKRAVDIEESTSALTISGDVRTEYRHLNETCNGENLRGDGAVIRGRPVSRNDFDIEFNLRFDYICDKTWASAHMRYDNSAGVDDNGHPCGGPIGKKKSRKKVKVKCDDIYCKLNADGTCNNVGKDECIDVANDCLDDPEGYHGSGACTDLCLKRAYMGYEFYTCGDARAFFELGRRGNLYNVFDSNIQFLSRFDGLLLKYENTWDCVADFYFQTAGFVVDERVNHFAYAAEIGFLNISDIGFDLKYSIINWEKHGLNRCLVRNPKGFRFINSQFTAAYNFTSPWLGKPTRIYAAWLVNHAAKPICVSLHHRKLKNIGWYAGVLFGKVRKEGDWAIEIQYQVVQAQAVPDDDAGGICRGNILDESFTTCSRRGNTNYKGWKFQGLYAFTDNLTLDSIVEWSKAEDDRIGGTHTYSKMELEAIYAF